VIGRRPQLRRRLTTDHWQRTIGTIDLSPIHASIGLVPLPYKIATLLYCFNEQDEVLLLKRSQEPNQGLFSPPGGKLKTEIGESPYACACREAAEEFGATLSASDLHLTGLVSEYGYLGQTHWLMFLFEVKSRLTAVPPPHREGTFGFYSRAELGLLDLPETDREQIWPLFWSHRGGFFAAHVHGNPDGSSTWSMEQSNPWRPQG
jgi:8-oxo-dGTP diphosphatase